MENYFFTFQYNRKCKIFIAYLSQTLLSVALLFFLPALHAQDIPKSQIESLKIYMIGESACIDAQMHIELTQPMQEALEKGISLYFVASAEVRRSRWYWFDAVDAKAHRTVRLSYTPLLRQYRVTIGGLYQSFYTLPEALSLLGQIQSWCISDHFYTIQPEKQTLFFSFGLDVKKLPSLFQVGLTVDKDWRLTLQKDLPLDGVL